MTSSTILQDYMHNRRFIGLILFPCGAGHLALTARALSASDTLSDDGLTSASGVVRPEASDPPVVTSGSDCTVVASPDIKPIFPAYDTGPGSVHHYPLMTRLSTRVPEGLIDVGRIPLLPEGASPVV